MGRQKEFAELGSAFESAAAGQGLFLRVTGEPGIGKTTLVEDFLSELATTGRPCALARGRCSERLAGTEACLPFLEALESLLHREGGEAAAQVMKATAPNWYAQVAPRAAEDSSLARVLAESKAASQERLKREPAAFLQEVSHLRPVLLFFDDLHWADASTVDLLAYLGEDDRRLLVAASVQGYEFDSAVVARVLERDAAEVEDRLENWTAFMPSCGWCGSRSSLIGR